MNRDTCHQKLKSVGLVHPGETQTDTAIRETSSISLDASESAHRQSIVKDPANASLHASLGLFLAQQGKLTEAEAEFREALHRDPANPTVCNNLGVALSNQGRLDEAKTLFHTALQLRPDYVDAHRNLAGLLRALGQRQAALEHLWCALDKEPQAPETLNALGALLTEMRRGAEAIVFLQQALRLESYRADIYNNLGLALAEMGLFDQATEAYQNALRLEPLYAAAHGNLGSVLKEQGRSDEALACYDLALRLEPKASSIRWNRALVLLQEGDWARGWEEYEWRWQRPHSPPRRFFRPIWDGSPLEGRTILLYAEQGLGDTIQFIRYASRLQAGGATVLFECPPPLVRIMAGCHGIDQVIAEGQVLPDFAVQLPLMSLPRVLQTTLHTVPAQVPYLTVPSLDAQRWEARLGKAVPSGNKRIGLAWQGNPHHQWDRFRSVRLDALLPLAEIPGLQLVSMQRGPGREQIAPLNRLAGRDIILDLLDHTVADHDGWADLAGMTSNLDLVLSVDTATAHLAGALGKPVWTLISSVADWRWMGQRVDSPWYPTMRLFRQNQLGNWASVVSKVAEALRCLLAGAHSVF